MCGCKDRRAALGAALRAAGAGDAAAAAQALRAVGHSLSQDARGLGQRVAAARARLAGR